MAPSGPLAKTSLPSRASWQLLGTTISGRYRVVSLLGEGGMGSVYLVEHTHMRKRLALKVLHPDMTRDPEVVARFEREAMAAAHIEHPNVAAATDCGHTEEGAFFLVLEYLEGQSLREALTGGPIAVARALHIARQVASALTRAHGLGIVHRDLKPENIMLVTRDDDHAFVKVLDFGIAKVPVEALAGAGEATHALTRSGAVFGTPEYMSPEQAVGAAIDGRADLYSLGTVLYEMLTGVLPYDGPGAATFIRQQISAPAPPLAVRAGSACVPAQVEALVMRLLAKEPQERPDSAQALIEEVDRIAQAEGLQFPTAPKGGPSSGPSPALAAVQPSQPVQSETQVYGSHPPASELVARTASELMRRFEALRRRLPAPLYRVPLWVAGLLACLVLVLPLFILLPGPRRPAAVDVAGEIQRTSQSGSPALLGLAGKYPGDVRVLRALVHAYTQERNSIEAMRTLASLLALDGSAVRDAGMVQAVVAAAMDTSAAADAAIALLEEAFGERGVDLLIDLAARPAPNRWKAKFIQSLAKEDVREQASPAALVALDLRAAGRCEARRALLPRTLQYGDRRALPYLRQLLIREGCGFLGSGDCWRCLRRDSALQDAISAIESRGPAAR